VIHHSATDTGGAARFDSAHRGRGWDELGYHFVIGNGTDSADGAVEVGSRWDKQKHGAHCKTSGNFYNDHGIGICLVGNFQYSRPTSAQMASLAELVRFLMSACGIPLDRVYTHGGITGKTACPGRNFSLAELKAKLSAFSVAGGRR
jgi:N-acetyl-anhydromuramyl-L-alanine amidase AmpD